MMTKPWPEFDTI